MKNTLITKNVNCVVVLGGGLAQGVGIHQKQMEQMDAFTAAVAPGALSPAEKLLVSSSLAESHYDDPTREVSMNMAAGSPEFTELDTDMQSVLDEIRRGTCTLPIVSWLDKKTANALPARVTTVKIGTGAQAVLSKGATGIEAKRIIGHIRRVIRRARGSHDHTIVFVIAGAGSGGTGTGAFIELLRMVRIVADALKDITVIAMPVLGARGCEMLHDSQREVDALYARTAGAFFSVCAAQAAPHAVPYTLSDNLIIDATQLADIVWCIEGDQGDPGGPRREPMYGLSMTAAGIVDSVVAEQGALAGLIPSWRDKAGQADPRSRMGSAGAASIRIDGLHLLQQASLLLTKTFYDGLLTRPSGSVDEGAARASQILSEFLPATLVRTLAAGEPVAWQPPNGRGIRTMAGLVEHMTDHEGESGPFPCSVNHDLKWLTDEIHTAGVSNLWMVSNPGVVRICDQTIAAYLGDPRVQHRREDSWTVAGWLSASRDRVVKAFGALLEAEMLQRTIDPNTGRPYTIKQKPTALVDTYYLLATLRERVMKFKTAAQQVIDAASPLLEQRASAFAQSRSELLDAGKSGRLQRSFLAVAQDDLDVRVWASDMNTWVEIAGGWIVEIDRWLDEAGEGSNGWFSYVRTLRNYVRSREDDLLAGRRKLACAANHSFVPEVGAAGEAALLHQLVISSGVLDQLRSECRLVWSKTEDGSPRLLIEGLAPAPSREREAVVQRLRELGSARANDYKVTNHVSADTLHYARQRLEQSFQALTVWDGLAFDFTDIEMPEAERQGRTPDVEQWTHQRIDALLEGSRAELALNGNGGGDVFRERIVWGPFTRTGTHPTAARVAKAAHERLNDGTFPVEDAPANVACLRAFECLLRVPFDGIELYEPLVASLGHISEEAIGLYAPEMCVRRAELLRRVLERHGIKRSPWTFGPAAMTLTADSDGTDGSLRRTALGLAADLLDVVPGQGVNPDRLGIIADGRMLADLGDGDPVGIIEGLRDPMNARAIAELDARIEDHVAQFRGSAGGLSPSFTTRLEEAAYQRWSKNATVGGRDEQDVCLLLLAEVLDVAETYDRRSGGHGDTGPKADSRGHASRPDRVARVATRETALLPQSTPRVHEPVPARAVETASRAGTAGAQGSTSA